jgi:hypothetical protein
MPHRVRFRRPLCPTTARKVGGRTKTYNPPVNSCRAGKTDNYRQLRLMLKIWLLLRFLERLNTAYFEQGSLKKSPKYF